MLSMMLPRAPQPIIVKANSTPVGAWFLNSRDIPPDTAHGDDAEEAQEQFPELPVAEFHAERHAVVFHKQEPEPVEHDNLLAQHQVGFNPYLDRLVDD